MTTPQLVFAVALASVSALIMFFAVYVVSSTMWSDRWTRRRR